MNSWCESCARKGCCYMMEIRPRCYVATTNTASGTPESYFAKSLRYSQDSHEIAKDEPQTCDTCKYGEDKHRYAHICNECGVGINNYEPKYEL
jgi:hypothetical protein